MKMYLISDNIDTSLGMRLAGVEGSVVHDIEKAEESLEHALKDKEIGIILVTERVANMIKEKISEVKLTYKTPLVIEIPDRHGSGRNKDSIANYLRDALGVNV